LPGVLLVRLRLLEGGAERALRGARAQAATGKELSAGATGSRELRLAGGTLPLER